MISVYLHVTDTAASRIWFLFGIEQTKKKFFFSIREWKKKKIFDRLVLFSL